jgi:hypothetical protein
MALSLDTSANPGGKPIFTNSGGGYTVSSPAFTTLGPALLAVCVQVYGPDSGPVFPVSMSGVPVSWSLGPSAIDPAYYGGHQWYLAMAAGALAGVSLTATLSGGQSAPAQLALYAIVGVPSTVAAAVGATTGVHNVPDGTPAVALTPVSGGSWVLVGAQTGGGSPPLPANATTVWDVSGNLDGQLQYDGRYSQNGVSVGTTTAGVPVTVGASTSFSTGYAYSTALEIIALVSSTYYVMYLGAAGFGTGSLAPAAAPTDPYGTLVAIL